MNQRKRKVEGNCLTSLHQLPILTLKNRLPYVKWNSQSVNKEQQKSISDQRPKITNKRGAEGKAKRLCLDQNHKLIYL